MTQAAGQARYRGVAIVLHWTIAALILLQACLGLRMGEARTQETFAVFQLHKSVGITILLLSLLRLAWRLTHRPPPLPADMPAWQKTLAGAVHVGLYLIMIGMPLTGWLTVSTSSLRLPTLLYGAVSWPDLPGFAQLSDAARAPWNLAAAISHKSLALLFGALLLLHVAGALRHQLSGSPVLARMAPGARPGLFEPRLLAILAGALAVLGLGALIRPPLPKMARVAAAPAASAPPRGDLPIQTGEAAASWTVDKASSLTFATAWGGQPIPGRFERWRADIQFSPHALARSRLRVEVDLASVSTGEPQRDAVVPGADWLGAPAQPKAVFEADRFEALGGDRFLAHGRLSLRGVTRPSDLAFRLTLDGERAHATGSAAVDRTAFGVGRGEWARTDQIPAAVSVAFDLTARKNPPGPVGKPTSGSS